MVHWRKTSIINLIVDTAIWIEKEHSRVVFPAAIYFKSIEAKIPGSHFSSSGSSSSAARIITNRLENSISFSSEAIRFPKLRQAPHQFL